MGRRIRALRDDDDTLVPLGVERREDPPPPPRRSALHALAVSGMSISALAGIFVLFLSIGIGLPAGGRRTATAIVVGAGVIFLACASTAVFTAARDTYPSKRSGDGGGD